MTSAPSLENYADALEYIYSFIRLGRRARPKKDYDETYLDPLRDFLARFDHPQNKFPVLLVAGTKGKGSTSAMCETILRQAGYRTGFYSSPHLHTFRERIRLKGQLISEAHVLELLRELQPHLLDHASQPGRRPLTAWEIMTTMAFLTFARAKVDAVVLEVGLGGRLDATNVSEPLVSVITRISYDHMAVLGKTLTKIAGEKAGIMRPQRPVVIAPQYPEALTALKQKAAETQSQPTLISDDVSWGVGQATFEAQHITIAGHSYQLALLGDHQAANAATAVTAVRYFAEAAGLSLPQAALERGLATVDWPGRMEILSREPLVVADSAMNGDSAERLQEALSHYFYGRNLLLIFGSSHDHDYTSMMHRLLPQARHTIVSRSQHPKATPPSTLSQVAKAIGYPVSTASSIEKALAEALAIAAEDDVICIAGSLFCAAEARLAWAKHAGLPLPPTDPI